MNGDIYSVENCIYRIKYNNRFAYFSTYIQLETPIEKVYLPKTIKIRKEKKIILAYHPKIVKYLMKIIYHLKS